MNVTGDYDADARTAEAEARAWLDDPTAVILDTETTDLSGYLVQIAVIDRAGAVLLDTLVNPQAPIHPAATRVHGLTAAAVADAPAYAELHERLTDLLAGRRVIIYNAAFDMGVLRREVARLRGDRAALDWRVGITACCAMELYAAWFGDYSDYHGSYRWQKLPGGDHTALGDARATLRLLERVAQGAAAAHGPEA